MEPAPDGTTVRAMVLPLRDSNPTRHVPVVTLVLIAVNVFVYFAVQPHSDTAHENAFYYRHAAIPCEIKQGHGLSEPQYLLDSCAAPNRAVVVNRGGTLVRAEPVPLIPGKNVYLAVIVSMFLHGSLWHLFGNMLFLWIFGNNVEDHMGSFAFTAFYFVAGIIAAAVFTLTAPNSVAVVIGASGAIAGVMGAYLVWFPRARILTVVFFVPLFIPAFVLLLGWFVLQFFTDPNSGVAWTAHVGGFAFGALVAYALRGTRGPAAPVRWRPDPPPPPGTWPGGLRDYG